MEPPDEDRIEAQLRASRELLRGLIRGAGLRLQDVDQKLGFKRGYISRLLHGETRLTQQQLLMILAVLKVEPADYYATLYPLPAPRRSSPRADLVEDLRTLAERILHDLPPPDRRQIEDLVPPVQEPHGDLKERMDDAVRKLIGDLFVESGPRPAGARDPDRGPKER